MAWQLCPLCKGTDLNVVCSICGGSKIISELSGRPPAKELNHPATHWGPAHKPVPLPGTSKEWHMPPQVYS